MGQFLVVTAGFVAVDYVDQLGERFDFRCKFSVPLNPLFLGGDFFQGSLGALVVIPELRFGGNFFQPGNRLDP